MKKRDVDVTVVGGGGAGLVAAIGIRNLFYRMD